LEHRCDELGILSDILLVARIVGQGEETEVFREEFVPACANIAGYIRNGSVLASATLNGEG
jgi:hypothetical protein